MIDTGGTIVKAAETLFDNGAADVIVAATHGILSDPARERLQNSRISEVIVTNTLPIPEEQRFEKLTVLSIAPILAKAITEVFTDGSVTSMFEDEIGRARRPRRTRAAGRASHRARGRLCQPSARVSARAQTVRVAGTVIDVVGAHRRCRGDRR